MNAASRYPVPAQARRVEQTVRRSRFITTIARTASSEDATTFVDRVSEEFDDATHNCWAFVAGPPGSTAAVGMSDDGEPHGTAGRPMLDVLIHSGVGEVAAVVTRYYGGVKLGKGGLGRAYSGSVQLALDELPLQERIERRPLVVTVDYASIDGLKRMLEQYEATIQNEEYAGDVTLRVAVPKAREGEFGSAVAELTGGRGRVEEV